MLWQATLFDRSPKRLPQKLMHVCNAWMPGHDPVRPRDLLVDFRCSRCGRDNGWSTMGLEKSKRGVPCSCCNA